MQAELPIPLIDELHIRYGLNAAINGQRRPDFAMTLAMFSADVIEHAQFSIAKSALGQIEKDEDKLKQQLGVRAIYKLKADAQAYESASQQNLALHQSGSSQARLLAGLQQAALSQFNDPKKIDQHVIQNVNLHVLNKIARIEQANQDTPDDKSTTGEDADATGLLDVLNQLQASH
ncbi:VC2046/SO_2500 family protein [Catenovulum sediminis]|uniref:VC2046/SO_2500 family protein n=1 Tax=Catenovulum sediminis TaxID=1740262 RepID=A0ABV1RHB0_9ALTE